MDVRIIIIAISTVLFGCSEPVDISDRVESSKHLSGSKFYDQRCVVCHGEDGSLGISKAKDLSKSNLTNKEIEQIINKGKGAMPPFKHTIESDSTLIELIEHIKTLRD